jgi:hypothetical protein
MNIQLGHNQSQFSHIIELKRTYITLNIDECYLVLFHTPLFTFVRPLVLLIFTNLTCFVCFVLIRSLHHELTEGAKMDMKNPEVRSNASYAFERRCGRT